MKKRVFVPIESHLFASPEKKMRGECSDVGLLAEALVLFDQVDMNITSAQNLADVLRGFLRSFDSIDPFLDLIEAGAIRVHYFDFISAPIEKEGVLSYWNIQDEGAEKSHRNSFQRKIFYTSTIENLLPKARHRNRLYDVVMRSALIDGSEDYTKAIEAAREAAKSYEDIEFSLNAFKDSLPQEKKRLFPDKITVTAEYDEKKKLTRHHYNLNLDSLRPHLPNLNCGKHITGVGLVQTHRILYASRLHGFDTYLPSPLSVIVFSKMDSFCDKGRQFSKTTVDLQEKACFPDIRGSFNEGSINWKDVLVIRGKATRFQEWFSIYGGKSEIAQATYGKEYRTSTGLTSYREKIFSIATYASVTTGAGLGASIGGARGAVAGALVGGSAAFAKDLLKASDEEGWQPRFFGNWIHKRPRQKSQ